MTLKNIRLSVVEDPTPYGIYVWVLPNGEVFKDDDGNVLNIPSMKGDLDKISNIKQAAAYYGQPDGQPSFIPGVGRVTEEEYQQDLYMMSEGQTPYGDTGAWRDAGRARRTLDKRD